MPDTNTPLTSPLSTTIVGPFVPSAARTTALSDLVSRENTAGMKGLLVFLVVTAASGTGGLTMQVRALPPGAQSGGPVAAAASAAVIGTGTTALCLYPAVTATSAPYTTVNTILPPRFSINVAVGDASSYTYSLAAFLLE
jgi:hypothetical protein